jgi:hypothetical protein
MVVFLGSWRSTVMSFLQNVGRVQLRIEQLDGLRGLRAATTGPKERRVLGSNGIGLAALCVITYCCCKMPL